ncbi:MAG: TnpV protein [Thomasclavelia spiroformis]
MKEIQYSRVGDYEFPSLKQEKLLPNLSKFGREYLRILKEKHPGHYLALRAKDELNEELIRVDKELNKRYETLIEQYKESGNITEELKEQYQIKWVQEMNDIKNCVEENLEDEIFEL